MIKKISYCFLFMLVCFGCGDESSNEDEIVKGSMFIHDGKIVDERTKNTIKGGQ